VSPLPTFIVDAFASEPFRGNPAGVCLLDEEREAAWMQALAAELNLSETAFVQETPSGARLRWFTPKAEVALCGHATLAAAHVLWETGARAQRERVVFETLSGALSARRDESGIEIDLPRMVLSRCDLPETTRDALGLDPLACLRTESRGGIDDWDYLIEVSSERSVRELSPDVRRLAITPAGVIVTALADAGRPYDFVSRYFAPYWGIDEDPVTGSAHCSLIPFWLERLQRASLTGYQASRRGGIVRGRVANDRVMLSGSAVTILRGTVP
jgi:PhzF family phenazine biosynthesis protein